MRNKLVSVKLPVVLAIIILALFVGLSNFRVSAATIQFTEAQITTNNAAQINPDIDGDNIVYQDNSSGNWDIYSFTLKATFTPETRITTNSANQINPRISGDMIVCQDDRNGNWDIYAYNLTSGTETQITNDTANQGSPDIDGNRIVWDDSKGIGIYDLATKNVTYVGAAFKTERYQYGPGHWEYSTDAKAGYQPRISGMGIVFQRNVDDGWYDNPYSYSFKDFTYSYFFNLSSGKESLLTPQYTSTHGAVIYDSRVAWVSNWQGAGAVYTKDLATGNVEQITNESADHPSICQNQPDIYYIVYQSTAGTGANTANHVYLYNSAYSGAGGAPTLFMVTNNSASQQNAAVSGGRIVYQDNRNGNWDVYLTSAGYVPERVSPPPYHSGQPQGAHPPKNQGATSAAQPGFILLIPLVVLIVAALLITSVNYFKPRKQAKTQTTG